LGVLWKGIAPKSRDAQPVSANVDPVSRILVDIQAFSKEASVTLRIEPQMLKIPTMPET
jgi:hypothetical protein